jgi:hypothetical protein
MAGDNGERVEVRQAVVRYRCSFVLILTPACAVHFGPMPARRSLS